ncbi:MAG: acylphosphatase [Euryarchaeota archaeon]|nr:acylphosphatase [Euryarchaeota archaeon]
MKRAVAIAREEVQSVGYRDIIKKTARRPGVTGQVRNLMPYDVEIIAEADEEVLTGFIEAINIQKYPVFVEDLNVRWDTGTGEYDYFDIIRGNRQDELFERMDLAGAMMYRSLTLGEETVALSKESVSLGRERVGLSKESVSIGREMLVKQDLTIDEIRNLRKDTKPYMDDKFRVIEKKLHNIEEALKKEGILV